MVRPTETDLARVVVAWLQDLRWDVYQEVGYGGGGPRADIVAKQGPLVWVIETKAAFGLNVLGQAHAWRGNAHRVSIAVPYSRGVAAEFSREVLRQFGIGLLIVSTTFEKSVREDIFPALNRCPGRILKVSEGHKSAAPAGTNGGGYWTPFLQTKRNLIEKVTREPGIPVRELIAQMKHHYSRNSTARSSLVHWIRSGVIPEVELVTIGRNLCVQPRAEA